MLKLGVDVNNMDSLFQELINMNMLDKNTNSDSNMNYSFLISTLTKLKIKWIPKITMEIDRKKHKLSESISE